MRICSASPRLICAVVLISAACLQADSASLHGRWNFELDPDKVGVEERWFETTLSDRINLPGSTDEKRCGEFVDERLPNRLSRLYSYTGPAWYQRDIDIPQSWGGKRITLFLERVHWETQAWLDDRHLGTQESLSTPHVFDLSFAPPGRHRLTLRVDNSIKYNVGQWAHSITDETQTNWNGIIGELELRATDPVWIEDVQVYPQAAARSARVRVTVGNRTETPVEGQLRFTVRAGGLQQFPAIQTEFKTRGDRTTLDAEIPLGSGARMWDESLPVLYELAVSLSVQHNSTSYSHSRAVTFGLRDLSTQDKAILLNGRRVFLRGTLECCVFPLTGYPAMDVRSWDHIFRVARSYGLNHIRFHSWCPPRAAFQAADAAGFILHIEAPQWVDDVGKDTTRDEFIAREVRRILDTYGNHPSFGMLCMGNELKGDLDSIYELVRVSREHDPRHLYASGAGWVFGPDDDYAVPIKSRGLHGPSTDRDFRHIVAEHRVPCISHEVGQWTVFPNLEEILKYNGVLKPRNFELVRDELNAKGMRDLARAFTQASGRHAVGLYKEEIEAQLRTPGISGFQLLSLQDFPGQGTALVGTLDAFWDSKGLIETQAFRRFCGPTVPLLRMAKRQFTTDETFVAQAEIAHYGPTDLLKTSLAWTIRDDRGQQVAAGSFAACDIPTGGNTPLGEMKAALGNVAAPAKLIMTVSLARTDIGNSWEIWVYPKFAPLAPPSNVTISTRWDSKTKAALLGGQRVLLLPEAGALSRSLAGKFEPAFWSPLWFKQSPATMSILCNPAHPALAGFPTEMHTNWQWYDLLNSSRTMVLNNTPEEFRPIVQVIDNFARNHKLGNLFETRVGSGGLVACSLDLTNDLEQRPAARQMLVSLLSYMSGDAFQPANELPMEVLDRLFRRPRPPASAPAASP